MPKTTHEPSLADRLRLVAVELKTHLLPVIQEVAGPSARPSWLVRDLGIDKSLASRLSRAARTEDQLEFLHLIPAPTGLRIFLDAAGRAKVNKDLRRAALQSVDLFQALIDETPGGRATIDASISASSMEARDRNERSAKQAVFKAMSYLLGFSCESIGTAFAVQPSADGKRVDCIDIDHRTGIRRLRPTAPVGLLSFRAHALEEDPAPLVKYETLDGSLIVEGNDSILEEFSSNPLPDLEKFVDGSQSTVALAGDDPTVDTPFSLTSGMVIRNILQRYPDAELAEEWRGYLLHAPCKFLVRDVYIRDDLFIGSIPEITLHIPSPKGAETKRIPGLHGKLNTLDMVTPIEQLGQGFGNSAVKEMPTFSPLLERSFERAGWDASRFRGYRTRVIYPVPMVLMTWWFPLPKS